MINLAREYSTSTQLVSGQSSPHTLMENSSSYSIVLNMLGIDEKDISIKTDEFKRELAVVARKDSYSCNRGFFWIFGVPTECAMAAITTRYKGGVLEIVIPKFGRKVRVKQRIGSAA